MAEGINVRVSGKLREFVKSQSSEEGMFESASEYIRHLIREDYDRQVDEKRRWEWLKEQLRPGMEADESEFYPLDIADIIAEAKSEGKADDAN